MRVLDLFCGAAGGWSLGLERSGYQTVAACEIDPWRRKVFAANHPDCVMYDDVRRLDAARLLADLGYLPDVIVGSPPCQDASTANTNGRGIDGERTGLFSEAIRLVGEIRPVWCCFENVVGLVGRGLDRVVGELEAGGYAVWPLILGARHAGANHRRDRIWIVACDAERIGCGEGGAATGQQGNGYDACDGIHAADASRIGDGSGRLEERREAGRNGHACAMDAQEPAHADREGQHGRTRDGQVGGSLDGIAADASGDEQLGQSFVRCGEPRHSPGMADLPPALAAIGRAWPGWNGGFAGLAAACAAAGFGRVDDELPAGIRNKAIAAYGDAVVPAITEAIGRSMRSLS